MPIAASNHDGDLWAVCVLHQVRWYVTRELSLVDGSHQLEHPDAKARVSFPSSRAFSVREGSGAVTLGRHRGGAMPCCRRPALPRCAFPIEIGSGGPW